MEKFKWQFVWTSAWSRDVTAPNSFPGLFKSMTGTIYSATSLSPLLFRQLDSPVLSPKTTVLANAQHALGQPQNGRSSENQRPAAAARTWITILADKHGVQQNSPFPQTHIYTPRSSSGSFQMKPIESVLGKETAVFRTANEQVQLTLQSQTNRSNNNDGGVLNVRCDSGPHKSQPTAAAREDAAVDV
nr:PREDICTED: uncharacterized protein LOC106705615 [Latimeria chalumnae]|eukprot:XP_014350872.1 PREDICTED: uncharacterized protein LOC106705615 [Latimeria chalumnae]